ncbi:MAG: carbamoyltransferase HypF [Nitrospirae bacterium CG18_big_fil_WC_8_21_14_2_50_70_55]|nr:carbamoyltransferase HypF [Deltaproteobacteria bacterium]PIQ03483.1 MAG: carbamoyltransferase HypF [Nitrospirae bacterium CG18_big_fil_WC_8_21_14_2_50_70_55]PIU77568.1 MAG: carbamoyltransferase HypF [Nitrospirae bacterium CG06_land_8_20_14_3_00_70_43]PIW82304.1 MAG: carbamoyltransferase HypF [Nitrospirae bacterium CG_4_8_14_3_um_filter_70_85]PIX82679.1 MAG: carbamoyltransferase HypF [Nitrospirae bacterium CG_4_10_14_3_um_filter_70_108]PJB97132.1 MAG: carbamoyltransferase HypF [Nitrospirae b
MDASLPIVARRVTVTGRVQGVGFRPFLYRLAHACKVGGWVRNDAGRVEVHVEGEEAAVVRFLGAIVASAPPLARPVVAGVVAVLPAGCGEFRIVASLPGVAREAHVVPDQFCCADCLAEIADPAARRYRYPFINCTQCGPRYTIIARLPYDRPNTAMARFPLCPECRAEYEDPLDRRFDAQPLACPVCGPHLAFTGYSGPPIADTTAALAKTAAAIRHGAIVAVRGIGGYHLLCDAYNDAAIARLRARKPRPDKPLAVMVEQRGGDGLDGVREIGSPSVAEAACLLDPMRPICLVAKGGSAPLPEAIAPGLGEIGVMLPYSPLHHLLLAEVGTPVVATSGNVAGEPVLTEVAEAEGRLHHVADWFLHHNRPILRPADDPVVRVIAGAPQWLRLGRGCSPAELALPVGVALPLLAVGGQEKNTICLAWDDRAVVSPHIGDLETVRGLAVFEQVARDLQQLYGVEARWLASDAHPRYTATRWARERGMEVVAVYHHHAHASALAGEHGVAGEILCFTWDGTGLGPDRTAWGGEALLGRPGAWRRVASWRPFKIAGGDRAGREPWRAAAAVCWEAGVGWSELPGDPDFLHQAWARGVNCFTTTAAGRLFDAAAALTGLGGFATYEGQGPMRLEAAAGGAAGDPLALPLVRDAAGVWRTDWAGLLPMLLDRQLTVAERAGRFHASLAAAIVAQARAVRAASGVAVVGLTGGCFQNRLLTEQAQAGLAAAGFHVLLASRVPANDAGLSYGQAVEAAARAG